MDTKAGRTDGRTDSAITICLDGRTVRLLYASQSSFGGIKIDKTKVLKTISSLMQVKNVAECSLGAFCNTFDLHKR